MMRLSLCLALVCALLGGGAILAGENTDIYYSATYDSELDQWEYTYDVHNLGLVDGIDEFTIWFDYGLYDELAVSTPQTPPEWDQIVWQVEPVLEDPGGYDAFATNLNIAMGSNLSGFSVTFDWLGVGDPGSQLYHIIDPDNYLVPIETGYTIPIPEPATLCLLSLGSLTLLRKRRA
jgi:hypothetical protein